MIAGPSGHRGQTKKKGFGNRYSPVANDIFGIGLLLPHVKTFGLKLAHKLGHFKRISVNLSFVITNMLHMATFDRCARSDRHCLVVISMLV